MITLITGSPGSGKTLRMVSELAKTKEFEGRKIFVDGITGLKLGNIEPFPDGHGIADMHIWAKDPEYHGSVFVIDEAQRFFPKRSSNSKVPELLEFLHVHRHYGLDIYIITQMPTRIDKTVCDLVGAHYHIHKNRLGFRMQYYWDYCATSPKTESRHAQASVYRLDKNAFKLYESAQIHTKVKQPKSKVRWIIPLALCSAVYFSMGSYDKFVALSSSGKTGQSPAPSPAPPPRGGGGGGGAWQVLFRGRNSR
jgi:zonula occludens toxin family protein